MPCIKITNFIIVDNNISGEIQRGNKIPQNTLLNQCFSMSRIKGMIDFQARKITIFLWIFAKIYFLWIFAWDVGGAPLAGCPGPEQELGELIGNSNMMSFYMLQQMKELRILCHFNHKWTNHAY